MIKSTRNTVYFILLMGIVQIVSVCTFIPLPEGKNNEPQKYALLIGGGITERDNFESFYKNIEYVSNTLIKLGYYDKDVKILFYGGETPYHPIVEGDATKGKLIDELRQFENTIDSNDSLLIFRSGHGIVEPIYEKYPNDESGLGIESMKYVGDEAIMKFPDGDLSHLEFQKILGRIKGKQIVVILNQCFSGQFADIALSLKNTVVITETKKSQFAINQTRETVRWKYEEWPFVKCIFDGFLQNGTKGEKQSVINSFKYLLKCNPNIEGIPVRADRPLLKENPQIKYGSSLKKGTVYIN